MKKHEVGISVEVPCAINFPCSSSRCPSDNLTAEALFNLEFEELKKEIFGCPIADGQLAEISVLSWKEREVFAEMHLVEIEWGGGDRVLASFRDVSEWMLTCDKIEYQYIEIFYDRKRIHSTLGGVSPIILSK